tara:strand:+ start:7423 stop:9528 length:2106 start_codon:yes stop_codon:yes gene_type:complete
MIPIKIEMENFFSHKNSVVDFNKFDSCLLIGNTEGDYSKSNGSGKSAVFESILWCLFNKSRAAMMDDIIRWGETTCAVLLEFSHSGKTYKVRRTRNRMNSTSSVEFYSLDSFGEWQDISGSTSGDTNKFIEDTIKLNYKTFINSIYFRQNDISEFAESDASRKKEILKSIVDISRWDQYDKSARKKARDLKVECKVLQSSISEYDTLVESLMGAKIDIKESRGKVRGYISKRDAINDQLISLRKEYDSLKNSLDTETYDRTVERISKAKRDRESLLDRKTSNDELLSKYSKDRASIDEKVELLEAEIRGKELIEVSDDEIEIIRANIIDEKSKVSVAKSMIEELEKVTIDSDSCHYCGQGIDSDLHKKLEETHAERIEHYTAQLSNAKSSVKTVSESLQEKIDIRKFNSIISENRTKIEALKYKRDLVNDSFEKSHQDSLEIQRGLDKVEISLESGKKILESIRNENFQDLRVKVQDLKLEKEELLSLISTEDKEIGKLQERISILEDKKKEMEASKKELDASLRKVSMFERLAKMFGKNGIQTILLDTIIEDLEGTSNKILSSICNEPSVIVLETQRTGSDGISVVETLDLKVRKDGSLQNFKSLSGGEKFRISLALRIALSDLSSRYGGSMLEFLLLDEVNSPLDRYGVETLFMNVIKSLEDKYKIMVITHDESLKEKFENVIDVTKVNGDSEICFLRK